MKQVQPFLQISGLSKSFGALPVVKDLSLSVAKGEFISLLGPSGCGKTTTLRIVAGFMSSSGGEIMLDGERIDGVPSHRRGAIMVFQNYALFPHMTVAENVGFGLDMQKVPTREKCVRVDEALKLVRLDQLSQRYPRELSGGQQQRVALARAIVLKPKLLLLDEPLSNLDAKLRRELRGEFLNIHRIAGTTTILVTHDLEEAFSVSDRVAVMNQGKVEQYADPKTIFTRPATPFVSEFVGHSNVVEGKVESSPHGPAIRLSDQVLRVPEQLLIGHVRMAIPSHLIKLSSKPSDTRNCLPVQVESASYLGSTVHYELNANGLRLQADQPVDGASEVFSSGATAYANWNATDFILLPPGES